MRVNHGRSARRKGQAMLETTLVLLVAVVISVGLLDVGRVLFMHQFLTERVRMAARYASVNPYNATKIQNVVMYGKVTPPGGAKPYMDLKTSNVVVTRTGAMTANDRVTVKITGYPFEFMTAALAGGSSNWVKAFDITVTQTYEYVN